MISQFVAAIRHIDPEITDKEIADTLWLALQIRNAVGVSQLDEEIPSHSDAMPSEEPSKSLPKDKRNFPPELPISKPSTSTPIPQSPKIGLYPDSSQSGSGSQPPRALPFRSPAATALPGSLDIARVLRPFKRRVPQLGTTVLNEEATAKRIAEEDIWVPVLDNALMRWLEVELVVDIGKSMTIWRQTITELYRLLARHGAFRDVHLWELDTNNGGFVRLYAGLGVSVQHRQPRSALELIDISNRRLVLVVTDCVSAAWHSGVVADILAKWGHYNPVTLLQVLPRRLWSRTALGIATSVRLHAAAPGTANMQLHVQSTQYWDDEEALPTVPIPIVTLEPKPLAAWAQAIARAEDVWIPGFELVLHSPPAGKQEQDEYTLYEEALAVKHSPAELVQRFRANASPVARRLAEFLAIVPITLPIVRLVQQAMFHEPRQVHLAEVLLSGLLEITSANSDLLDPDDVQYDVVDGVREILLNSIFPNDSSSVLTEISDLITSKFAHPIDFAALLANPLAKEGIVVDKENRPFALFGAKALRRFGGKYVALADWLEERSREREEEEQADSRGKSVPRYDSPILEKQFNFETFTDRREAIALFNMLRGRDADKPWPLLPILAFVGPGGSGKSLLLRYLREKECSYAGRPALPHASLDFTLPHTPKELLPILMALRDQLQQQDDGKGNHLVFPRFDLGALIAQAASTYADISSFGPTQVRQQLTAGMDFITTLSDLGSSLGYAVPYVAPLLAGLRLAGQVKPLKELLSYLENSTGWKWYRMHGTEIGLGVNTSLKDVLLRLHLLSMPGRPERDFVVNELLPAAFLADLFDTLLGTKSPLAWGKTANLVIFLDGFEALQRASSSTATRLLQILTIQERKEGNIDPTLLVVGSRDYLPGSGGKDDQQVLFQRTAIQSEQEVQRLVKDWYVQWQQHLPPDTHFLRLKDLYLTLELGDFGQEDTRSYLLKLGEQKQTSVFADDSMLIQTIGRLTRGHPFYLSLAAEAVLEANARGKHLTPSDFELAAVSQEIAPGHEDEHISDYLLDLFLRQLSEAERKELLFCAVPRFLDAALLRVLLPTLNDIDRQQRWNFYRGLTFMRPAGSYRIVFHPLVRTLLLRQLPVDQALESDYYRFHVGLRDYFHTLANQQRGAQFQEAAVGQARIEEAYHALALGDLNPAIALGIFAQQSNLTLWGPLLEAVAQAPTELMPDNGEQQAYDALVQAERHHNVQGAVNAIILYTWLLTISRGTSEIAYMQNNLGNAYSGLPGGDREANLRQAIACYEAALQVRTREAFPVDCATIQNNLGVAYRNLPGGDREANLRRAIACYEAALQVRTREAFPIDWATTQNNLGNAYSDLPGGDRQENLRRAIACYEAALQVRTREAFPIDWATTQNNLGTAYSGLSGGDREENLRRAIACFEAALQVYTRDAFPIDWATTQNNLGNAYRDLREGDLEENLSKAKICYQAALEVFQLIGLDYDTQYTLVDLKQARDALQSFKPPDFLQKLYDIIHQIPTLQNVLRETSNVFGHYIVKPRCKTVNARLIEACSHIHEFAAILDQSDDLKVKAHRVWLTNALLEFSEQTKVVEASISRFCDIYGSLTAMNQPVELRKDIQQQLDVLMNRSESVLKNVDRLYNELSSR